MDVASVTIELIGAVVGGILSSLAFVLIWELYKRPSLRFVWLADELTVLQINGDQLRLYHIRVHNYGRSTAENCFLVISYRNHRLEPIVTLRPGKWDDNPEPVTRNPADPHNHIFDLSFLHLIGRMSIRAHSSATFCFLIKYEGEEASFGFNADNYRSNDLRRDDRRLDIGEYVITFAINGDNVEADSTFLMRNNGIHHGNIILEKMVGNY